MNDYPPWGDRAQPPPGYGTPGYGQPGYGAPGQPGYGAGYGTQIPPYGGWPAPPPAPGGVPLRPLGVGDILSGAFTLIRRNPAATLGLAAIIETISAVASTIITWIEHGLLRNFMNSFNPNATPGQAGHALLALLASLVPFVLVTIVLAFLFQEVLTGMLTGVLGRGLFGDKITIGEAWRMARVIPVIGVTLLAMALLCCLWIPYLAVVIGLAAAKAGGAATAIGVAGFLGLLPLTIWIGIRLSIAVPVVVLEGAGPMTALRRSWQLVQGNWWRVFGITLLAGVVVFIVTAAIEIPFTIVRTAAGGVGTSSLFAAAAPSLLSLVIGAIGSIVASTCTRPVSAGVTVLLYADLRMRKEGLDLALQQAGQGQAPSGQQFMGLWQPGQPPAPGLYGQPPSPGASPGDAYGGWAGSPPGAEPGSPPSW